MAPPNKTEQQLAQEMMQRYRNVFATEEGQIVLGDILTCAGFGERLEPTDPVAVERCNQAVEIARMAGAFNDLYRQLRMTKEN